MYEQSKFLPFINELSKLTLYSPTITSFEATCPPDPNSTQRFKLSYSQVNYQEATTNKNTAYINFDPHDQSSINQLPFFPTAENDIEVDITSSSHKLRALFRRASDKLTLEIWSKRGLWKSLRVSDFHDIVYNDPTFCISPIVWSQDEKRIMYIAEEKEEDTQKYFEELDGQKQAQRTFDRFLYKQHLGEGYEGRKQPFVFIYSLEEEKLYQVLNTPKNITPVCVSFKDKQGTSITFSGIDISEVKLGLKGCANRRSQIYYAHSLVLQEVEKKVRNKKNVTKHEGLTSTEDKVKQDEEVQQKLAIRLNEDAISLTPIVSRCFNKVAFFFSPWKNMHTMACGLKVITFNEEEGPENSVETVLQVIHERRKADEFPGITGLDDLLVKASWYGDHYIVFNAYLGCSLALYIIDIITKEVQRLDQPYSKSEEWRIRNVCDDLILITISSINIGHRVAIYHGADLKRQILSDAIREAKWYTFDLALRGYDQVALNQVGKKSSIDEKVLEVKNTENLFFSLNEAMSKEKNLPPINKRPLVVFLHGGPHAVHTGVFSVTKHYLLHQGYNLLYPNFRGSLGYGQKFIEELAGKIGEVDREEIMETIEYCVEEGLCDENKVAIYGGSYGGYLCGVLLARHSERFRCGVIINPVTNINHLWVTSDIPDWATYEALNRDTVFGITADEVKKMHEMSPMSMYKSKDIKSSVLLCLGEKDRRVPYGAGLQYYNMLKMTGADIRMLTYPNNDHSMIGDPEAEFDFLLQTLNFFNEKLKS